MEDLWEGLRQDSYSHLPSGLGVVIRLHLDQCQDSIYVFRNLFDLDQFSEQAFLSQHAFEALLEKRGRFLLALSQLSLLSFDATLH